MLLRRRLLQAFAVTTTFAWIATGCYNPRVKDPGDEDDPFKGTNLSDKSGSANEAPPPKSARKPDMEYIKDMLRRSADQAAKCDNSEVQGPRDVARVTVSFRPNGHISEIVVSSPHEGTAMGECIRRAFDGVIVTSWEGEETVTIDREVDFSKKEQGPTP